MSVLTRRVVSGSLPAQRAGGALRPAGDQPRVTRAPCESLTGTRGQGRGLPGKEAPGNRKGIWRTLQRGAAAAEAQACGERCPGAVGDSRAEPAVPTSPWLRATASCQLPGLRLVIWAQLSSASSLVWKSWNGHRCPQAVARPPAPATLSQQVHDSTDPEEKWHLFPGDLALRGGRRQAGGFQGPRGMWSRGARPRTLGNPRGRGEIGGLGDSYIQGAGRLPSPRAVSRAETLSAASRGADPLAGRETDSRAAL